MAEAGEAKLTTDARPTPPPGIEPPKERVRGVVLRVTYENKENDYRVVKLQPDGGVDPSRLDARRELVLVGALPGLEVGESIEAEGRWMVHPKHGPQFKADWFKPSLPTGARGIEAYLASGSLKGIGEVIAKRIVQRFGEKTFDILDKNIDQLLQIKGISPAKLETIRRGWVEARGDRELITFLGEHGISPSWAGRLRRVYGDAALSIVRSNPYRLAAEVRGVGFHRADVMARRIGLPHDSPERIDAALGHVLETQASDGHTFLPKEDLGKIAAELLEVDLVLVEGRLAKMIEQERLKQDTIGMVDAVFLNPLWEAEKEAAKALKRLAGAKRRTPKVEAEKALAAFERSRKFELSAAQRHAVLCAAREGMMVLTGGPGTGKTTTLRSLIHLFVEGGMTVRLAAPTGRAARRLAETSRMSAETIHRLLGFNAHTGDFAHGPDEPIEADLVVVDEASMLDVSLASDLFNALSAGTCLLLVGDEDQLPSVGPGNVLRDVINSGLLRVVRLQEIFRQAESSLIVVNAHRINRGEPPHLKPPDGMENPDFFFIERDEPADVMAAIKAMVAERIPGKYKLDPVADIQVLTPMRRGELGVEAINRELQSVLNPPKGKAEQVFSDEEGPADAAGKGAALRVGDRVMQTANNYDKEVFNGDVGRIARIDGESGEVTVQFDGRAVGYLADEARQLALAYAATIHKSQGSEYRAVVIPLHTQHYIMLRRNLLYTALTRGRELAVVIGNKKALWRAVRDASKSERNSALGFFLASR